MSCPRILLLATVLLALTTGSVFAQDQQTTGQEQQVNQGQPGQELGEVVVTATRRDEDINKVPISITAVTQANLEAQSIVEVEDLFRQVPGVTYSEIGAGVSEVSVRGVISQGNAPTTGVYIDDTPIQVRKTGITAISNFYPQLVDLERVEVLRGPQGTLFGAGAEGGAIRFITKDPDLTSPTFYARTELGYTVDGGPTNGLALSGSEPFADDKAALSVQAAYQYDGGYIDKIESNGYVTEPNTNWTENASARIALKYQVTDSLTLTPSVFFQRRENNDYDSYWPNISNPDDGKYLNGDPTKDQFSGTFVLPALKAQLNLGGATVVSDTSYFDTRTIGTNDYTGYIPSILGLTTTHVGPETYISATTPTILPIAGPNLVPDYVDYGLYLSLFHIFVQEARVQSNGNGPLTWVVGVFYSHADTYSRLDIIEEPAQWAQLIAVAPPDLSAFYGSIPLYLGVDSYYETDSTVEQQIAGFGEASWEVLTGLKLTAGVRVQHQSLDYVQVADGPLNGGFSTGGGSERENPVTPKYGVSYQINPTNMVYATAAKGFRNGGANTPLYSACNQDLKNLGITSPTSFRSDSLWSYEVGAKDQLLDHRLSIESSAFLIDWNDIQQLIILPICQLEIFANLGAARSEGGDLQVAGLVTDDLTLTGTVAYTNAFFSETVTGGPNASGVRPILAREGVAVGGGLEGSYRPWTFTAEAQYRFRAFDLPGRLQFVYQYEGRAPITSALDPLTATYNDRAIRLGGYGQLDLETGVAWKKFDLSLYAKNLLNVHPLVFAARTDTASLDFDDTNTTLRPLTVGLQGIYRY